jgi:diacylglycerol kinase family enzyme
MELSDSADRGQSAELAGTDAAIGVLPMGTLNHFAKDVGIPRHLEAAVRNIFTGLLRPCLGAIPIKT